jgi:PAS domain S-box-containing protein
MASPGPVSVPQNEPERLAALRAFDILDTAEEQIYDQITRAAADACAAPVSLLSFVDGQRQWCKSHHGVNWRSTKRDISFCTYAIAQPGLFTVRDAQKDERFRDNPLVNGPEGIRFYAGLPLRTAEGHAVGTLCVIDREPRDLTNEQIETLKKLSESAMRLVSLRRKHGSPLFAAAVDVSSDAIAISDATQPEPTILYANHSYLDLTGLKYQDVIGKPFFYPCPVETGERFREALREARPDVVDCDLQGASGRLFETITFIPYLDEECKVVYCVMVHRDRTAEKESETQRDQLHAMKTTLRSINHVILNFMNAATLFRSQMEGKVAALSLMQFDVALENTRAQLVTLAAMPEFKERKTPFGFTMLDPDAAPGG